MTNPSGTGDTRFKPGHSGNPGGRPKGRKALESQFIEDLYASWQTSGKDAIARMIAKRPADYVRMVAGLLPKDINLNEPKPNAERIGKLLEVVNRRLEELEGATPGGSAEDSQREPASELPTVQ